MKKSYMHDVMKISLMVMVISFFSGMVNGQQVLQQYVEQAIQNNLLVKEKKIMEHADRWGNRLNERTARQTLRRKGAG